MQQARQAWSFTRTRWQTFSASRPGKVTFFLWKYRKTTVTAVGSAYLLYSYRDAKAFVRRRDEIHPKTILIWRIHDGSIVEQRSNASTLNLLVQSQGTPSDEPPRVMTLWEVVRALRMAAGDDRIEGLLADFSHDGLPNVPAYSLGLAQIEELSTAISQLKELKEEKLGKGNFKTAAFADTFASQGDYLLASAFDKIYVQPSGEVALTGISASIPFYSRLLSWLGIDVHAEARSAYKSMVAPYTADELSPPQRENEIELLDDLHTNLCAQIAVNRFGAKGEVTEASLKTLQDSLEKVRHMVSQGPFSASEALANGLIDGIQYRRQVAQGLTAMSTDDEAEDEEKESKPVKGFYHYAKVMEKAVDTVAKDQIFDIGVVYLLGAIGEGGSEFGTSHVVKGLKEAGADESIGAVVLRIDSGGGGVVPSDTIHDAVQELREKGKVVVASFANAAASGAYLVSTHADAIVANSSTITGSIGVAALRPTVTPKFLDRLKLNVQSFFNGSKYHSLLHPLEGDDLVRFQRHVDEHYADFKARVVGGREISPDVIEYLAGGRVMTGGKALTLTEPAVAVLTPAGDPRPDDAVRAVEAADVDNPAGPLRIEGEGDGAEPTKAPSLPLSGPLVELFQKSFGAAKPVSFPNPFGRGLIDGLGGLADAAVVAAELYLSRAVAQLQMDNPGMSSEDALAEVLPDMESQLNEDGSMQLSMDVNLRVFPREKTLWQTLSEQSARGDGIDPTSVGVYIRTAFAALLARMLSHELDALGLGSLKTDLAAVVAGRRPSARMGLRMEEPLVGRIRL